MITDNSAGYVELNAFLKIKGIAATGGRAKFTIREGLVKVNGVVETRNKRKLRLDDKVEYLGVVYTINQELLK